MKRQIPLIALGVLLLLALLLAGCRSSGTTTRAADLPVEWPTAQAWADTVRVELPELAPIELEAMFTLPRLVEEFPDTLDLVTMEVAGVAVSRDAVTITTPTERRNYTPPAWGERLRIRPGESYVEGQPEPRRVEVDVVEEETQSLWERLAELPAWVFASLFALTLITLTTLIRALR